MGIFKALTDTVSGALANQSKGIITAGTFSERNVVGPGILQQANKAHGADTSGSIGVICNGLKILVPGNTAAFIFSQSGIENIITTPGKYVYQDEQVSIFNEAAASVFDQVVDKISSVGQISEQKNISFVNLCEIRGIKFGTKGPLIYNDLYYGAALKIVAFGAFSLQVVDVEKFVRNFVPPNVKFYSFDDQTARDQILSEFLQSFANALSTLSAKYRVSQLPSQVHEVAVCIRDVASNAGAWGDRFGLQLISIGFEKIELTQESQELINQYSSTNQNVHAYENVAQNTSNIDVQQKTAQGTQDNGLGEDRGMNAAQATTPLNTETIQQRSSTMTFDEQIENFKKLKELLDIGVLSQDEFDAKKREVMGL